MHSLRLGSRANVVIAVRTAAVCLAAYLAGSSFTSLFHAGSAILGGVWSVVSGIVVLQATLEDTRGSAMLRVLGTFLGAVVAALYLSLFRFHPLGTAAAVVFAPLASTIPSASFAFPFAVMMTGAPGLRSC